jgi:hypothetical protein
MKKRSICSKIVANHEFDLDSNSARKRDQRVVLPAGHLEMGIHARFRVFLPLLFTTTTSPSNMDIPTTTETQNKAGIGRRGEAHPFSQQGTYFFHTDHATLTNVLFSIYTC